MPYKVPVSVLVVIYTSSLDVLLLRNGGDTLGLSAAEHEIATGIFSDTAGFWRSQQKPFWVFFC